MVLFRLEMYGLAEQKIKGDGNCQVLVLLPFKAPLWGFVSINWTEIWHLFFKRFFLLEGVTWGEGIYVVKKSLSAVIHMLKADSESLIKVDMSYSNIYFWVQNGSIFSPTNTPSIILKIDRTINFLG
jgi:hypothetical protein